MRKSEHTKERIIAAAIEIVSQKGYSATSTKEIAQLAEVSEATLFKYYGSKDELLKQIVLSVIDEFINYATNEAIPGIIAKNKDKPTPLLIRELIIERVSFFRENANSIRLIFQEMAINETVRQTFEDKIWYMMVKITDQIFDLAKARGEFRDIDNYFLRKTFVGMMLFSFVLERFLISNDSDTYSFIEEIDNMLDILFYGVIKEES